MRYIEKNFHSAEVIAYEKELADNRLDKDSLADEAVHPALDGPGVYDTVKSFAAFGGLKCRMYAEQGGICCYCGCRLQYPNHPQYVVEHVFPKEKDRTLAGEYGNLLLSCRPTAEEEKQRMTASRKERKSFFHCDKAKESEVLSITPLQEDSPRYFQYDMFGGIVGTGCEARNAIATLNLGW